MAEIELKLRGTPARLKSALARLERAAVKGSRFKKNLNAVYFDTAKDDLQAKGLSFRVRDEDGRFIQTLKQEGGGDALTREEWNDNVSAQAPELLVTKSGRKLRHLWKDVRLVPRFRTVIARHGFLLSPRRGTQIEVVRDEGEIQSIGRDDESVAVSEIELELKQGPPSALYALALQILATTPVQIETRAKSARGYALHALGGPLSAVKALAAAVDEKQTIAEVLRGAARRHFGQFLANMAGALKHDPDSIHQMRVAMRRLRAALYGVRDLLPEAEYDAVRLKLKYLLQSLGAARDWEVLTEHLSELDDDDDFDVDTAHVQKAAQARKHAALLRAVDAVGSKNNTKMVLEAMLWFEELPTARHGRKLKVRVVDAAPAILNVLFEKVRRRGRHFEEQSVGDRHRLRISCKNLRYNTELFSALYGKRKVERFLACLKPVQDDLGHLNDVSRARDLLGELAKRSPQKATAEAVVARLEARVAAADKRARKHVAALRDAKAFW